MVVKSRNNWGIAGGIEAQRGDLWVLDLEAVLADVRQASFSSRLELPQPGDTLQFARQVSFPEVRIGEVEVKSLNTPKLYPSFDDAVGGVRIDFLVDATTTALGFDGGVTLTSKIKRSKIYSLLYGWRILTRVGRLPYGSEDMAVLLPTNPVPLGPIFKKDVKLYFLQGSSDETGELEVSMAFVMKNCWISSIQLNNVDQASAQPLTITAAVIPEEIYPIDPPPTIRANIAQRSSAFNRQAIGSLA